MASIINFFGTPTGITILLSLFGFNIFTYFKSVAEKKIINEKLNKEMDASTDWLDNLQEISSQVDMSLHEVLVVRSALGSMAIEDSVKNMNKNDDTSVFGYYVYFKNSVISVVDQIYSKNIDKKKICAKDASILRAIARQLLQDRWDFYKKNEILRQMFFFKKTRISNQLGRKGKIVASYVRKTSIAHDKILDDLKSSHYDFGEQVLSSVPTSNSISYSFPLVLILLTLEMIIPFITLQFLYKKYLLPGLTAPKLITTILILEFLFTTMFGLLNLCFLNYGNIFKENRKLLTKVQIICETLISMLVLVSLGINYVVLTTNDYIKSNYVLGIILILFVFVAILMSWICAIKIKDKLSQIA